MCLLGTAQEEGSVGEQSQAVSTQEEDAAAANICTRSSVARRWTPEEGLLPLSLTWGRLGHLHGSEALGCAQVKSIYSHRTSLPKGLLCSVLGVPHFPNLVDKPILLLMCPFCRLECCLLSFTLVPLLFFLFI